MVQLLKKADIASVTSQDGKTTKYYTRLDAALSAVQNNETVELLEDLTIPTQGGDNGSVTKGGTAVSGVVLNLGGHTISAKDGKDAVIVKDGSSITIKNGTIKNEGVDCAIIVAKGTVTLEDARLSNTKGKYGAIQLGSGENSGTVIMNHGTTVNGNIVSTVSSKVEMNNESEVNGYVYPQNNSEFVMNGGTINGGDGFAITGNGSKEGSTKITINGGTLKSDKTAVIYHPQAGTLDVKGGTLTGKFGIVARRGNVNVTGGKITATGTGTDTVGDAVEGADKVNLPAGTAIVIDNKSATYEGNAKAKISGGEFEASNETPIVSLVDEEHEDFEILGGAYNKAFDQAYINAEKAEVKIGDKFYVGDDATKAVTEAIKDEKAVIEVLKGNVTIEGAVPGVTVLNSGNGDVTVNGMNVTTEKVVVPAPEKEDEEDKDPTPNTGIDVFAVAGAILVVSALGVVVLNKRK